MYTAGGGAVNEVWTAIRAAKLGVPVLPSPQVSFPFKPLKKPYAMVPQVPGSPGGLFA